MRTFDNGSFYTVQCTTADVLNFANRWPCFGPRAPIAFEFDKANGDLVDVLPSDADAYESMDPTGVRALSEDAQAHGRRRLGLQE